MSANPNPVSGEYDILALAPVDGDKVRLSAQVYNYSTAKSFTDCLVQFYKIKLDPDTDREIGPRQLIGTTLISLLPRARRRHRLSGIQRGPADLTARRIASTSI